jgi:hypothetical protein
MSRRHGMATSGFGIALGEREVRALIVRAGAVQWHASAAFSNTRGIAAAVHEILSQAPRPPVGARFTAVIAPAWVQVKPLSGLPPVKSARMASEILRENQQAFFLWKGAPALTEVQPGGANTYWGAAFDQASLDELTQALRTARMNVRRIAPAAAAIATACPNQMVEWTDGTESFVVEGDRTGIRRLERAANGPGLSTIAAPPLGALGPDAHRYLDAYAAAVARRRLPLSLLLKPDESSSRLWARVRRATVAAMVAAAVAFAALGPGVRARNFAQSANVELELKRAAQIELAKSQNELRRVTDVLNRVESFRSDRGKLIRILSELAQSIPDSTAMLSFHVDSVEGAFTAVAPHVADVLPELVNAREIASPRIVGSVTREVLGGVHLERASFRFRRPGQAPVTQRRVSR